VDDNAQAREILTDALRVFALRANSVESGQDAIREIAAADSQDPYRLVLMDWHMPGMDGLEASRIIKRDDRLNNVPKIVMVTAFGREDIRKQAEEITAIIMHAICRRHAPCRMKYQPIEIKAALTRLNEALTAGRSEIEITLKR